MVAPLREHQDPVDPAQQRITQLEAKLRGVEGALLMLTVLLDVYLPNIGISDEALNQFHLRVDHAKRLLPDYFPEGDTVAEPADRPVPRRKPSRKYARKKAAEVEPVAHPFKPEGGENES